MFIERFCVCVCFCWGPKISLWTNVFGFGFLHNRISTTPTDLHLSGFGFQFLSGDLFPQLETWIDGKFFCQFSRLVGGIFLDAYFTDRAQL